jgi:hypothetical protein
VKGLEHANPPFQVADGVVALVLLFLIGDEQVIGGLDGDLLDSVPVVGEAAFEDWEERLAVQFGVDGFGLADLVVGEAGCLEPGRRGGLDIGGFDVEFGFAAGGLFLGGPIFSDAGAIWFVLMAIVGATRTPTISWATDTCSLSLPSMAPPSRSGT